MGVVEVAVIGVEDHLTGEKIVSYISTKKDLSSKEIQEYCSQKLANYEIPSEFIFLKELPKNQSLKIDYVKLKQEQPTKNV